MKIGERDPGLPTEDLSLGLLHLRTYSATPSKSSRLTKSALSPRPMTKPAEAGIVPPTLPDPRHHKRQLRTAREPGLRSRSGLRLQEQPTWMVKLTACCPETRNGTEGRRRNGTVSSTILEQRTPASAIVHPRCHPEPPCCSGVSCSAGGEPVMAIASKSIRRVSRPLSRTETILSRVARSRTSPNTLIS